MIDLDRLIKLLNLTQSENDHEALLAIRRANSLIDGNWEKLLGQRFSLLKSKPTDNIKHESPSSPEAIIVQDLKFLDKNKDLLSETDRKWRNLLKKQWAKNKSLTTNQMKILREIVIKIEEKKGFNYC